MFDSLWHSDAEGGGEGLIERRFHHDLGLFFAIFGEGAFGVGRELVDFLLII